MILLLKRLGNESRDESKSPYNKIRMKDEQMKDEPSVGNIMSPPSIFF